MSHRGVEGSYRQACVGRVLPRHHRQRDHFARAPRARRGDGGAGDAVPDAGRVEERVLLGVVVGVVSEMQLQPAVGTRDEEGGQSLLAQRAVRLAAGEGGHEGAGGACDPARVRA